MTAAGWRESWDRQQSAHEPERERSFSFMLDFVELVAGEPRRVLDLACGTGSITERVLRRFPSAEVVAVDVDPVMLWYGARSRTSRGLRCSTAISASRPGTRASATSTPCSAPPPPCTG